MILRSFDYKACLRYLFLLAISVAIGFLLTPFPYLALVLTLYIMVILLSIRRPFLIIWSMFFIYAFFPYINFYIPFYVPFGISFILIFAIGFLGTVTFNPGKGLRLCPVDILNILMIVIGVVFFMISPDKAEAMRGFKENLKFCFLFLFIRSIHPSKDDLKLLCKAILIIAVIASLYGIFQYFYDYYGLINYFGGIRSDSEVYFGVSDVEGHMGARRAYSIFLNNFLLAYFLMAGLLIALAMWVGDNFKRAKIYLPMLVLFTVCFALTLTRSAWGGFAAGCIALLLLVQKKGVYIRREVWWSVIALSVITVALSITPYEIRELLYVRGKSIFSLDVVETSGHYHSLVKDIGIVMSNPSGIGLGKASAYVGEVWNESSFFKIATEMGVISALIYVLIMLIMAYRAYVLMRRSKDKDAAVFSLIAGSLIAAFFIAGIVFPIWMFWFPTMLVWVFGASVINWAEALKGES